MGPLDDFLATLPEARREAFERVRVIAETTAGETTQGVSYAMAGLMYRSRPLLLFYAAKKHLSLFPCSGTAVEQAMPLLEGFNASKGTVRFAEDHPLPEDAVVAIVRARMSEIEGGRR